MNSEQEKPEEEIATRDSIASPEAISEAKQNEIARQVRARGIAILFGVLAFLAAIYWCVSGEGLFYSHTTSGPGWTGYESGMGNAPIALAAVAGSLLWILIAWLAWRSAKKKLR